MVLAGVGRRELRHVSMSTHFFHTVLDARRAGKNGKIRTLLSELSEPNATLLACPSHELEGAL